MSKFRIVIVFVSSMMMAQKRTQPVESPLQSISPVITDRLIYKVALADFETKDVLGRTWRLADFQGKLTVVVIWSTWW